MAKRRISFYFDGTSINLYDPNGGYSLIGQLFVTDTALHAYCDLSAPSPELKYSSGEEANDIDDAKFYFPGPGADTNTHDGVTYHTPGKDENLKKLVKDRNSPAVYSVNTLNQIYGNGWEHNLALAKKTFELFLNSCQDDDDIEIEVKGYSRGAMTAAAFSVVASNLLRDNGFARKVLNSRDKKTNEFKLSLIDPVAGADYGKIKNHIKHQMRHSEIGMPDVTWVGDSVDSVELFYASNEDRLPYKAQLPKGYDQSSENRRPLFIPDTVKSIKVFFMRGDHWQVGYSRQFVKKPIMLIGKHLYDYFSGAAEGLLGKIVQYGNEYAGNYTSKKYVKIVPNMFFAVKNRVIRPKTKFKKVHFEEYQRSCVMDTIATLADELRSNRALRKFITKSNMLDLNVLEGDDYQWQALKFYLQRKNSGFITIFRPEPRLASIFSCIKRALTNINKSLLTEFVNKFDGMLTREFFEFIFLRDIVTEGKLDAMLENIMALDDPSDCLRVLSSKNNATFLTRLIDLEARQPSSAKRRADSINFSDFIIDYVLQIEEMDNKQAENFLQAKQIFLLYYRWLKSSDVSHKQTCYEALKQAVEPYMPEGASLALPFLAQVGAEPGFFRESFVCNLDAKEDSVSVIKGLIAEVVDNCGSGLLTTEFFDFLFPNEPLAAMDAESILRHIVALDDPSDCLTVLSSKDNAAFLASLVNLDSKQKPVALLNEDVNATSFSDFIIDCVLQIKEEGLDNKQAENFLQAKQIFLLYYRWHKSSGVQEKQACYTALEQAVKPYLPVDNDLALSAAQSATETDFFGSAFVTRQVDGDLTLSTSYSGSC